MVRTAYKIKDFVTQMEVGPCEPFKKVNLYQKSEGILKSALLIRE
jgi:hypothetical protein